jgi:hypothetical protein
MQIEVGCKIGGQSSVDLHVGQLFNPSECGLHISRENRFANTTTARQLMLQRPFILEVACNLLSNL